ncbi:uro-adherence factor A-like [Palaemon carinicauda]|uniref:uro-adherence factor A-like n=1 Tax=Palaemon carinicauda TaxID=392227 RepID=UPI0035B6816D
MRIKVDFSEFFDDERKLSVVNVNTEESVTVHDVLEKIVRLFKLTTSRRRSKRGVSADDKPEYGLFEEGFYIPPEETSTVLQEIGILKLKSLSDAKVETPEKKKKHKKKKAESEIEEPRKTRKNGIEDDSIGCDSGKEENIEKKRKKSKVEEVEGIRKRKNRQKENSEDSEADKEDNTLKTDSLKKTKRLTRQKLRGSDQDSSVEVIKVEESKKKKKRKQQCEESNESESEEPHEEDEILKKTKKQTHKTLKDKGHKSLKRPSNEEIDESQQSVESSEITATSSSNNHKKEISLDMSVTSTDEIESNALRKNKRWKKDKATESEVLETSKKCSEGGPINKKLSKSTVGSSKEDEKLSQEKEVSTSNFADVECEEAAEKSVTSENPSVESSESELVFSTIDDGYKPGPKSKRRRRHAKRKKKSVPSEANEEACVKNAIPHSSSYNFSMNASHKNNVSTTSTNKHVVFGSDDEEEVSCHSNSCDGNDIEIVGQVTRPSGKSFLNSFHSETRSIIDIEGEDNFYREHLDPSALDVTADDLRRMYAQRIGPSLDALSNIRRMCEQNTLTVVRVTSKTESVTTQTFRLPDGPAQTFNRGPPSSFPQDFEVNENIRKTFRNLLSLQDCREPLILKPSREPNVFLGEIDVEEEDLQLETPEVIGSSGYSSPIQACPEDSDVEPDMLLVSDQSDLKESECTPLDDKPGPSTRSAKKDAPRPYHALGRLLMSLRNPGCSRDHEGKLHTEFSPEEINEASHQPVIEILDDASKGDNNTSSALADAESSDPLNPDELNEEADVQEAENCGRNTKCKLNEKDEEDLSSGLTKELKGDQVEELKDGNGNKDAIFSKYPIMRSLPRVGEFLAIKTLVLDENLCPVHSNYMKVQVLEVNGLVVKMKNIQCSACILAFFAEQF